MGLQKLAQGVIGVSLAIAILFFAGVSAARYLIDRLTELPPRPVFPNDTAAPASGTAPTGSDPSNPVAPPDTTPVQSGESYTARVLPSVGLIVRGGPSRDSEQIAGLDFNQQVTVLETTADGEWLRVQLEDGTEGWVKSGNTERVN